MVRAVGSYPTSPGFDSLMIHLLFKNNKGKEHMEMIGEEEKKEKIEEDGDDGILDPIEIFSFICFLLTLILGCFIGIVGPIEIFLLICFTLILILVVFINCH